MTANANFKFRHGDTWRIDFQVTDADGQPIDLDRPGTELWLTLEWGGQITHEETLSGGGIVKAGDQTNPNFKGRAIALVRETEQGAFKPGANLFWAVRHKSLEHGVTTQGDGFLYVARSPRGTA